MPSYEQQARDIMERCGWKDAQACTAADVVELANILQERDQLRKQCRTLAIKCGGILG